MFTHIITSNYQSQVDNVLFLIPICWDKGPENEYRVLKMNFQHRTLNVEHRMRTNVHLFLRKKDNPRQTVIITTQTVKASMKPDMG